MNSGCFTVEDIHRIRYENYKNTKNLSPEELIEDTNKRAENVSWRIEEYKMQTFVKRAPDS